MPNLMAHFGAQGFASRAVFPKVGPEWVLLGCLLPDVPWIISRGLMVLFSESYSVRLYAISQGTLAVSLLLAASAASLASVPRLAFAVLGSNTVVHLLLDAIEIKWGNAVYLLAPLSWTPLSFDLFWPDSLVLYALSALGVLYLWIAAVRTRRASAALSLAPTTAKLGAGMALLVAYLVVPLTLMESAEAADTHFVKTLRDRDARPGKRIDFDRLVYTYNEQEAWLRTYTRERLWVAGPAPKRSGVISARAVFVDSTTVKFEAFHLHRRGVRDAGSYLGLMAIVAFWLRRPGPVRSG